MTIARPLRCAPLLPLLLAVAGLAPPRAAAQVAHGVGAAPTCVVRLAAEEQVLWLIQVQPDQSLVYRRGVSSGFERRESLRAAILEVTSFGGTLYAFSQAGEFWSLSPEGWLRQRDLPQHRLPISLVGADSGVYALIPSPPAGELSCTVGGVRPPESQPFDPQRAPLSVVRYDPQGWLALAPAPDLLRADLPVPPRLGVVHGSLCVFAADPDRRVIEYWRLDFAAREWHPGGKTPVIDELESFWVATISRVPSLVAASRAAAGGEQITMLRALGGSPGEVADWRVTPLNFSSLPPDIAPRSYESICGFNQHAVALLTGSPGTRFVQFARSDGPPVEATLPVATILDLPSGGAPAARFMQMLTLALLFGVLLSLFVFRRGSMVTPATLPEGAALAFTFQRLIGGLIDLAPFALVTAALLGVNWQTALRDLSGWAAGSDTASGHFPSSRALEWWGLTALCHSAYALVMELVVGRTVGKLLVGTRLLSETGQPARAGAILVRNLVRILEFVPPLWVLGFLVLLSRNRQRLGDIYARTVIVRRAK